MAKEGREDRQKQGRWKGRKNKAVVMRQNRGFRGGVKDEQSTGAALVPKEYLHMSSCSSAWMLLVRSVSQTELLDRG